MESEMFALFFIIQFIACVSSEERIVQTRVGRIRGTKADDGDYYQFLGIPYGMVDNNNRFGLASPFPEFEEVFEANDDSVVCPQFDSGSFQGSLDCLNLNIYVPETASEINSLPVMLWIHGGGFIYGSGNRPSYGPKFLVKHDVIMITVNYRLGPYGFMCLDIPQVPGNQGLKDLLMGMRWIKNNIGYFGGDKDKITIFGESAGGMALDYLLLADTEELFHNTIIMSGTSLTPINVRSPDNSLPIAIADNLGLSTSNVNEALSFLNTFDPLIVVEAGLGLPTSPCVENEFDGVERILSDFPINMKVSRAKGRSFLMGHTSDEAISMFANLSEEEFQQLDIFNQMVDACFQFDNIMHNENVRLLRNFYIGDEDFSREVKFGLSNFISDIIYLYPTQRSLTKVLANGAEKVYYYKFSYIGDRNFMRRALNITVGGAAHADELGYFFDIDVLSEVGTPEDFAMIDKVTTLWTNFAKYGDPTPGKTQLLPIKWEPVTQDSPRYCLDIDSELTLDRRPFRKRVAFWDLFLKTFEEYELGFSRDNSASYVSSMYLSVIPSIVFIVINLLQ